MLVRVIIGIVFIAFAIVQYNDPDPWLWIVAYSIVGVMYLVSTRITISKSIFFASILVFGLATLFYLPKVFNWVSTGMPSIVEEMKASTPHIEWMREFLGLLLCLLGLVWLNHTEKKKRP